LASTVTPRGSVSTGDAARLVLDDGEGISTSGTVLSSNATSFFPLLFLARFLFLRKRIRWVRELMRSHTRCFPHNLVPIPQLREAEPGSEQAFGPEPVDLASLL
jgi:hypothetical protein